MNRNVDQKIVELYEDLKRNEKIKIHLKNIERLITIKGQEVEGLQQKIAKEEKDIQKLEKYNLFRIFATVLGNYEQQLEKERHEHLQAILLHKGEVENLNAMLEERELVRRMISGQFSVRADLEKLIKERERVAIRNNDPDFKAVFEVAERLAGHRCKIKEIKEAIKEGRNTRNTLEKIVTDFSILERWHTGVDYQISSRGKSQLRRIEKNIYKANNNIQRFHEELLDLHDHFSVDYEEQIQTINNFLGQLIDSLITDWVIKRKLHHSLHLLQSMIDKITLMIGMLKMEISRTEGYISIEEQEKMDLTVKAIKTK